MAINSTTGSGLKIDNPPVYPGGFSIDSSHCSGGGLAKRIIQRQSSAYAILNGRLEISPFQPEKAHRQLAKIVSFVPNRGAYALAGARRPRVSSGVMRAYRTAVP